ncbi:hypothetical protein D3C72_1624970 [compost metagenome]
MGRVATTAIAHFIAQVLNHRWGCGTPAFNGARILNHIPVGTRVVVLDIPVFALAFSIVRIEIAVVTTILFTCECIKHHDVINKFNTNHTIAVTITFRRRFRAIKSRSGNRAIRSSRACKECQFIAVVFGISVFEIHIALGTLQPVIAVTKWHSLIPRSIRKGLRTQNHQ